MSIKNLQIILINDDPDDAILLRGCLVDESERTYSFVEKTTGEDGIRACLALDSPGPDCVIVDLHLPDMGALEVLRRFTDDEGEVRFPVVVFIDSGQECKAASAALRAGAQEYIAKSWVTPDGLACAVEHAIERFKLRERLRAKRTLLRRQDHEFKTLIENVPDIITRFDTNCRHIYINPAIERATGLSPESFLGKTSREAGMRADLCDFWESILKEVMASGTESTFEFEYQTPAGPRSYLARHVPQLSAKGEVDSVLAVSTEVTQAKRAEEALRASEQHLRNVIDRLVAFVGVMTPAGILVEANEPALAAASLNAKDVLGKPFEQTYWWSYSAEVQADLRRAIECAARGELVRHDVAIRIGEDRFVTIDFMISPLVGANGQVTHLIASGVDITQRKRTEEQMRTTAARERVRAVELKTVLKATPAAIWITKDRDCRHITGNPASYKLLGLAEKANVSATPPPGEPSRRSFQEFRAGVPIAPHELPMQVAATQGVEIEGTEMTLRFDDGSVRHIYGNAAPLRYPDGTVYGAISAFVDITTLKHAEESVRVSEERFRLASEAVSGMIYEWDAGTGHVERSAGLVALAGYRPEEAEPTRSWWIERVHPDDRDRVASTTLAWEKDQEALYEMEYRIRHRDGGYRYVWDRARAIYDSQGRQARMVGYTIDVTERVQGEEVLRLNERRFRRLATSDVIGIAFGEIHGVLTYVNDEFLRIIGTTREQFEAKPILWTEITPPQWHPADEQGIAEARARGSCLPYEKEYIRQDGSRVAVLTGYTLLDESGEGDELVAFILDLSDRKRSEKALRDSDKRKNEFLAMLAHELRNPLATIRTAAHFLLLKGSPEHELTWGCQLIERQAKHLTRLIEDLLDVSRINTGKINLKPMPIDFRDVASRAAESAWPLMTAKQHDLKISLPPQPLAMLADPARLEQVLTNLLSNAAKYTDNNGSITLSAAQEGSNIVLRLRDTGIGIAPDMLPGIFDLYTQVDGNLARSLGGLGIGLTLVKTLVELHGGSVSAASEGTGEGSEFTIVLPALDSPSEHVDEATPQGLPVVKASPRRWRPRVLVVDDNVDMALGLAILIETSGYEVKTAHEGMSALSTARVYRPEFVILDIGLPGMDGYELARAFKREADLRGTTLIAISGYGRPEDRERAREAGFDHHMLKPVELEALLAMLAAPAGAEGPAREDKD